MSNNWLYGFDQFIGDITTPTIKNVRIQAREKYLYFDGFASDAIALIDSLHTAYYGLDMPKALNDFVFNLEVALQNAGIYDEDFNLIGDEE